jgi:hypothetical protein
MITWAALLLLRGVEDGMTHQDGMFGVQGTGKTAFFY